MTGVAAAALLSLQAPAQAASDSPRVITVFGGNATLGISDASAPGPTPGDVRTLSLALTNTKGQPAGRAEIVQTLTRQDGGVGTAVKVVVLHLPGGTITAIGQSEFADFTNPQGRPIKNLENIAVVGGTGAYRGASGNIRVRILPDFASKWVISLSR